MKSTLREIIVTPAQLLSPILLLKFFLDERKHNGRQ